MKYLPQSDIFDLKYKFRPHYEILTSNSNFDLKVKF